MSPTVSLLLTQTHVLQATLSGIVRWRSLRDLQVRLHFFKWPFCCSILLLETPNEPFWPRSN